MSNETVSRQKVPEISQLYYLGFRSYDHWGSRVGCPRERFLAIKSGPDYPGARRSSANFLWLIEIPIPDDISKI